MIQHRAAVLGKPIEHSLSPVLHNAGYAALGLTDWHYERIECDAEQLPTVVGGAPSSYVGFSVTMPGKFAALSFADTASHRARAIGSANTLVRTSEGWRADNTDCDGVTGALRLLDALTGTTAVVVGGGGTARPALWALARAGYRKITVLNRTDKRAELAPLVPEVDFALLPLDTDISALAPDVVVSTVPSAALRGREDALAQAPVLDVIYDPWPTPLVQAAQRRGVAAVGGHVMLAHQAFGQFEQFTGRAAPQQAMLKALEAVVL